MRSTLKVALAGFLVVVSASLGYGATVTGSVKGPDSTPFMGAFVQAQNLKTRITFNVLTDKQGRYRMENLPAGDYQLKVKAVGFKANPQDGVSLTPEQNASFDFALQKGMVRWADLSLFQAQTLLPEGKGKDLLFGTCASCHGFQTRMASTGRDLDGWKDRVDYMRQFVHFFLSPNFTDQNATDVASYINSAFGVDSELPRSPAELPGYAATVHRFSDEAMKIVFVEYDMPGPDRMPWSAVPYKDGNVWIPDWAANRIARLNPKTGEVQEWPVPYQGSGALAIHSAFPAPDGTVWFTEQGVNKLGHWDPKTQKITEYADTYTPGKEGLLSGGSKHTVRLDHTGYVWSSGSPLTRLDPETGKYTHIEEVPNAYSVDIDKDGNIWFTMPGPGQIGKVDAKTLKVTKWNPPTPNNAARRIIIDSDGYIWFGEYTIGKVARFDPKTETFKEFNLPGPPEHVRPYAIQMDKDKKLWYSSYDLDVLGRLDPATGQVTEYPWTHTENMNREFFLGSDGRMWYASGANNKVGYFYLTGANLRASK